jgi:uncharacterized protein (DUF3820 family)
METGTNDSSTYSSLERVPGVPVFRLPSWATTGAAAIHPPVALVESPEESPPLPPVNAHEAPEPQPEASAPPVEVRSERTAYGEDGLTPCPHCEAKNPVETLIGRRIAVNCRQCGHFFFWHLQGVPLPVNWWAYMEDEDLHYMLAPRPKSVPCFFCGGRSFHADDCFTLQKEVPFGKHKGKLLIEVPEDYLRWMLRKLETLPGELREAIQADLRRRRRAGRAVRKWLKPREN